MRILDKQPIATKSINKVYATFDSDENMIEFLKTVKKFYFLNFKKKEIKEVSIFDQIEEAYIFNPYKIYFYKGWGYCYPYYDTKNNKYELYGVRQGERIEKPTEPEDLEKLEKQLYSITLKPALGEEQTFLGEKNIKEPPYLYTNITFQKGIYLECAYEEK